MAPIPTQIFKALAEPNRADIFKHLCNCACATRVNDIAPCCKVSLSVTSRYLAQLRDAGLLESERRGKEVYYWIKEPKQLADQLRELADYIETANCCCQSGECK